MLDEILVVNKYSWISVYVCDYYCISLSSNSSNTNYVSEFIKASLTLILTIVTQFTITSDTITYCGRSNVICAYIWSRNSSRTAAAAEFDHFYVFFWMSWFINRNKVWINLYTTWQLTNCNMRRVYRLAIRSHLWTAWVHSQQNIAITKNYVYIRVHQIIRIVRK